MIWKKLKSKLINLETFLYAVFGVLTSILNVVLFRALLLTGMVYTAANLITLVVVKITAYICNKNFVFRSHCPDLVSLLREIERFIVARGATMLIDYFGLIILVEFFHIPKIPGKIAVTILVIVLNYIIGKKHVFKNAAY